MVDKEMKTFPSTGGQVVRETTLKSIEYISTNLICIIVVLCADKKCMVMSI